MSEQEIARAVVDWLEGGWDVYQEVAFGPGVADLVAVNNATRRSWVIEVKTSLSLAVLSQAWHWIKGAHAHRVSVAVPSGRRGWKQRTFAKHVATTFGIGVLFVSERSVKEGVAPVLNRRIDRHRDIRDTLQDEHKTHAKAGSSRGGHWTPFKATCKAVTGFVRYNPGCTARELVAGIKHHYASNASARSSLIAWASAGKLPGIVVDKSTRPASFRLEPTSKPTT